MITVSAWRPSVNGTAASHVEDEIRAYNANHSHLYQVERLVNLSDLPRGAGGIVVSVESVGTNDVIARRLRDLGFVAGEAVSVLAFGPISREPILVRIGDARFALRRAEAARVQLQAQQP